MADIRNPGLNVEDQEKPLDPKTQLKANKIHRRDMLVMGIDTTDLAAIFMSFLFEVGRQFIEHIGRFFMFPLSVFAGVLRTIFAWQDMQIEKRKKGTLQRFVVELASTILITVAVAGSLIASVLASAAFTIAAPVLFIITMAGKAVFSLGSAIHYWMKKKVAEAPLRKLDDITDELNGLEALLKESPGSLKEAMKNYDCEDKDEARRAELQKVIENKKKEKEDCEQEIKDKCVHEKVAEYDAIVKNNLIGFVAVTLAAVAIGAVMLAGKFVLAVLGVAAGVIGTAVAVVNYKNLGVRKADILKQHPELDAEEKKANELTISARLCKALGCFSTPAPEPNVEAQSLLSQDPPSSSEEVAPSQMVLPNGRVLEIDNDDFDDVESLDGSRGSSCPSPIL